ncbi:MAG TPA: FHA domain-containing serine/threonine-protein kinase [Planctomycetota bacterium]|nr:FHA domain-containing serine/threonine-protein kinase [Planctomycetota bacterium]
MNNVPTSPAKQLIHLLVVSGPDKGKNYFIQPRREALIGRVPAADLRLSDPNSSGRHCLVRSAGDIAFIEDLNSSNGTFVNGEPISSRILDERGTLKIGTTIIELNFVATERAVPLAAVQTDFAPTLLESNTTARMNRIDVVGGSTIIGADQLALFRAAQKQLGSMIGDFLLLEVVGMGSLGFVFRAKKMKTREEVALKAISRASLRTEKLLKRFLEETKTGLTIPGAVKLLDKGEDPGYGYITMELTRGRSLQAAVENEKKFTLAEACGIILSVAGTLQAAHAQGLVHRDVKPANILCMEDGSTRLLDLGMGRKSDAEGKSILAKDERLESVVFMSPELTRQAELDARADVYSLGATLYCILSGHRPFSGKNHVELIRKIRWESPPLVSDSRKDVPPALAAVIARALEKEAPARFHSMDEFAAALSAALK